MTESRFLTQWRVLSKLLSLTAPIHTGEWQSQDTSRSPAHATYELLDITTTYTIPSDLSTLKQEVQPSTPWAEEHFAERVSGIPHNPPPSAARWPYRRSYRTVVDADAKFSHTYPERFWPRDAGGYWPRYNLPAHGIRFRYGDLSDVVDLLFRSPLTRQAYLPVWFPEDTGNHANVRVPCTLGYHFMIRNGRLRCWYFIRSCDIVRHYRDDVYLAARLTQWICLQINNRVQRQFLATDMEDIGAVLLPGELVMHISSLHAFASDKSMLDRISQGEFSVETKS